MTMTDKFSLPEWAEKRTAQLANDIKSYIDCGMEQEDAIDKVFESSILARPYKMRALELCANYHHEHTFVTDKITGREWCKTCQTFKTC